MADSAKNGQKSPFTNIFVFVISALITTILWGSATPAIKCGYELFEIVSTDIPTKLIFAGTRFTGAGIMVLIMGTILQKHVPLPAKEDIVPVTIIGFFQTSLTYLCFYVGLTYTTGAKGSLFSSCAAFFVVLVQPFVLKGTHYTWKKLLGCVLGFAGLYLICFGGTGELSGFHLAGEGLILSMSVIGAFCNFYTQKVTKDRDAMMVTGWQLTIGGLILVIAGLVLGGHLVFRSAACFALILYMMFLSATAFALWTSLLKYNDVAKVSMWNLLTPVFGMILSGIFLHENILQWSNLVALVLVCGGIAMVNTSKK